ncbi:MAG: DUF4912 domain-containing protein [Chthoniobacterales bacterium]
MSKKTKPDQPKEPKAKKAPAKGVPMAIAAPIREAFDHLGELPHGYGVDTIFLIAQEPHWLFTYWDIDIGKHPGGVAYLRYYADGAELEGEVEVPFETRNWYLPVKSAATEYFVEIGFYRDAKWQVIARSIAVTTPPEGMAASENFDYATIPFHLSFQRLVDNLESAARSGEDLLAAVSRMQQKGDFSAFGGLGFGDLLTDDQRALLATLLGQDFAEGLSSGAFSSGDIESRIRSFLEEQLSSGGASEFLSSFREVAGVFSAGAFSGETASASWGGAALSSWTPAAFASWAQAALTSWSQAAVTSWTVGGESSGSQISMSSWLQAALTSWSQATLTSWTVGGESSGSQVSISSWLQAALTSWGQAAVTSWTVGGESSGSLVSMSSWLQGAQSSWAQAALTSWSSAEVTSWFSGAATTSWSGASESLSSFGERDSNAGVVLHGGTDPRVKITINGQPIALNPDGTFRYHLASPNADCKIQITATP